MKFRDEDAFEDAWEAEQDRLFDCAFGDSPYYDPNPEYAIINNPDGTKTRIKIQMDVCDETQYIESKEIDFSPSDFNQLARV